MLEQRQDEIAQASTNSYIHYIAYSILALGLIVSVYFNFMPQTQKEPTAQESIQSVSFNDLSLSERTQYIHASEFDKLQKRFDNALDEKASLTKEITSLQEELQAQKNKMAAVTQKEESKQSKEESKEEPVHLESASKVSYTQNSHDIQKQATQIVGFTSCYDMNVGQYNITQTCKKSIEDFVSNHHDAAYFEIIGIVDETEFILYKNLQTNDFIYDKLGITQQSVDLMRKLSQSGLAKHRAIEANWVIKSNGNKDVKAYNANYHLHSNSDQRGVVIRAYQ